MRRSSLEWEKLHLEVYVERIKREYGVAVETGAPKVSYRESATASIEFDHKRKKQTGGSGQYGHIVGVLSPMSDEDREEAAGKELLFIDNITGGRIPQELHSRHWQRLRRDAGKGAARRVPRGRHQS